MREEKFDEIMLGLVSLFQESNALNQQLNESVGRLVGELVTASEQTTVPDFDPRKYPYTCHIMKSPSEGINWPRVIESLRAEREEAFKALVESSSKMRIFKITPDMPPPMSKEDPRAGRSPDTREGREKEAVDQSGVAEEPRHWCNSYVPNNVNSTDKPSCGNCKNSPLIEA